jgi:hypothetical protein
MLSRNTLLTMIMLGGTCLLRADPPSIDPTALTAVQYSSSIAFGAGTGTNCPHNSPPVCFASIPFPNIPAGQRFVITNISGNFRFNPNGGSEVPEADFGIILSINGTYGNYTFPFDSSQQLGNTTYYYMNKNVKLYADPTIGFGWEVGNLNGVGPVFVTGSGGMTVTVTGYLVPNK